MKEDDKLVPIITRPGTGTNTDSRYRRQPMVFRNADLVRFLQGAENGVVQNLKEYLEVKKTVSIDDICEETERTALMLAAMGGHLHCVEYLVGKGADVCAITYVGMTPILAAAGVAQSVDIVKYLLDKGANLEAADHSFFTPLIACSEKGCLELVNFLLSRGANVSAVSRYGFSSLNYAVANGHVEVAEVLIKHNADIQRKDGDGFTPLMRSTTNGYYSICELLIQRKARVNEVDGIGGNTALHFSTAFPRITALLLANNAHHSPFNKNGDTPLMLAASRGDSASLKMLRDAGSSIHYINNFDQSALSLAAINNRHTLFIYLSELGAEDDLVDHDGANILMLAAAAGAVEVVAHLLQRTKPRRLQLTSRDPLTERKKSTTPRTDRIAITSYLQDKHTILRKQDHLGNNALLHAAKNKQLEMVIYLAEEGSDLEVQNVEGTTALMFASRNGDIELVKYLCEVGLVHLDVVNGQKKTASHLARNEDTSNVIEYFREIRIIERGPREWKL
jgi:ankyrin repeat protein